MFPNSGGRLRPGMIVSQTPPVATGGLWGDNAPMTPPLLQSQIPGVPCRRGKVRDVYDLGDRLAIVATDRLSAFDWVLPTGIPGKGRLLTQLSAFWFNRLGVPNHFLSLDLAAMGEPFARQADLLDGRSMLVWKTAVVPVECVV